MKGSGCLQQYESDLSALFWETLEKQYGLKDGQLYEYLVLRSFTEQIRKGRVPNPDFKQLPWNLIRSIMEEWECEGQLVSFMGDTFRLTSSSLQNISIDWHQRYAYLFYDGDFERDIFFKWQTLQKQAKIRQSKWSKKPFFTIILQQEYLHQLNSLYRIQNFTELASIDNLVFLEERFPIRMEVKLERLLHPHLSFESHVEQLSESRLEEYLYQHLSLLEDGLRPVKRQYSLENGRIDILAKDRNDHIVIIEVKVDSDTDLVWQEEYYVKEIEKVYGVGKVRFMAVVPKYEAHILNSIHEKKHCQVFTFDAVMKGTTLKALHLKKEGVMAG